MNFKKRFVDSLFVFENQDGDRGFSAFVIPHDATPPTDETLSLKKALTDEELRGSFVLSARTPSINDVNEATDFVTAISNNVPAGTRQIIWLSDLKMISASTVYQARLKNDGTALQTALNVPLTTSLIFQIQGGIKISLEKDNATLLLGDISDSYSIGFSGPSEPDMRRVTVGTLPFSGSLRGCVQFTGFITRSSLFDNLQCGFQFLIPNPDTKQHIPSALSEWLPLVDPTFGPTDYIGFNISIDPSDPYNEVFDTGDSIKESYPSRRTFFDFTGKDFLRNPVTLKSFYNSSFGESVLLIPGATDDVDYTARLVISIGEKISENNEHFHLCPEGDFILLLPETNKDYNHYLRCGLSGTEFFKITPQQGDKKGDILRFISRMPAFVENYPFPLASPVAAPFDPTSSPFSRRYRTAWATVINNSGNVVLYVSQPKGAALYGINSLIDPKFSDLFGHNTPGFQLTPDDKKFFPMVPYSGLQADKNPIDVSEAQALESTVISPLRRTIVSALSSTNAHLLNSGALKVTTKYNTTPSGLIAKTTQSEDGSAVKWDEVQLGWNMDRDVRYTMAFVNPPNPLIDALQSSDVFLVVANRANTGNFQDTVSLSSWKMQVNIGTKQTYGDYRNIMILKGRKGKLYDPKDHTKSLVANPKKWTQSQAFSVPSTSNGLGKEDSHEDQLIILSQWLQSYFEAAQKQEGNGYFGKFNTIANQDDWTGILFLRVDITTLPENLKGIIAGITEPEAFNAHHLGIETSPVKKGGNGPVVEKPSSIFGLIYYVDPDFSDTKPVVSIAPSNADIYNFRLLSLKVLFENSSVKNFESYAQLTLNKLFGSTVTKTKDLDNVHRNVLLAGSLQINNGEAVYSLGSQNDDAFYIDSNIINKVEITNLFLSTRSGNNTNSVVSWFGMSGFIDFYALIDSGSEESYDVFSFGNDISEDKLKKGLNFSNLGIRMNFSKDDPSNSVLVFDASEITFDVSLSTPRQNSLYLNMVLDLDALLVGSEDKGPKESGYLDVIPDLRLAGVSGSPWYGLRFKLNMGTPGELAGKVNIDSYLLLSWSSDSTEKKDLMAGIGIALPGTGGGAKLISLQNVMKLSIGQIRLRYIKEQSSFLLLFTEIALKFLGLLKIPPNGNTLFYLFGNPNSDGKSSGLGWYTMYVNDPKKKLK